MKISSIVGIVLSLLLLSSCGDHLEVSGMAMRTKGAPYTVIGAVGFKNTRGDNQFDRTQWQPTYPKGINATLITQQHTTKTRKIASKVEAEVKDADIDGSIQADSEQKVKGRYDLYSTTDNLVQTLNHRQNNKTREMMIAWGSKTRVITAIAKAYGRDETITKNFTGNLTFPIKQVANGTVTVTGNSVVNNRYSEGTTYAYEISRPCWKVVNGKIMIVDLIPDRPGFDKTRPHGTTLDPQELIQVPQN